MNIRLATTKDLDLIVQIIDAARQLMQKNGNTTQWINGYPSKEVLLNDILLEHGFVCEYNNKIVGYFGFLKGNNPEPTYTLLENGAWLNEMPYGVVHRLASNGTVKGVAKACFDYCFSQIENVRVDTHRDNQPMQNFLRNYGFKHCGTIYVADGSPRDAFQMEVNNS
ncbi:MAG TPA: GNAT family N-acetyltransferase [Flavobacterium sp.]|nr:GNAT family N-acetyltransferase [Flavobacterium sp.]